MRNVVVHEYFGVDAGILWLTATRDVPNLEAVLETVKAVAASEPSPQDGSGRDGC